MLLFNTCLCHLTTAVLSPDLRHATIWQDPLLWHDLPLTLYQSLDMIGCLLNIIILSCYHLTPSMIYLTCDYHLYGNLALLSCIMYSDLLSCTMYSDLLSWMELSATQSKVSHYLRGGGHLLNLWGPPLESVGPSPTCTWSLVMTPVRLISHKKDNLHGEWEEVMNAGMMSCL